MKPGSVSVRSFQTCFPQTFSNQVDPVVKPEDFTVGPVRSRWFSSRITPSLLPLISQLFKDWFLRTLTC